MTPEHRFRTSSHDLPPLTPAEFTADRRVNSHRFAGSGLIAIILLAGILCIAIAIAQSRAETRSENRVSAPSDLASLYREIDLEFEKHVTRETKKRCRYKCAQGRSTMFPECVLVCDKGKG